VKVNDELTILVTHPTEAKFRAFSATCTHAGCLVSGVKDGQIACGCHGARFNMESGEPEEGPAKSALKKLDLEVRGKELWARFSS
jgi:Rieske Fe-S protein